MAVEFLAQAEVTHGLLAIPSAAEFSTAVETIGYKLRRLAELNGVHPNSPATATWTLVCAVKTGEPTNELKAGTE